MLALQSSAQSTSFLAQSSALPEPLPPPPVEEHTVEMCKNYVIHELTQTQTVKKPVWKDTMYAMFGDHVPWEELRVIGLNTDVYDIRSARPIRTCPITGLPAPYLDPRTNVPFASVTAFQTLSKILSHQYVWSNSLGCYVSRAETALPEDSAQDGRPSKRSRVGTEDV
ncbi:hypothetical protein ID866_11345 [Astraeus odoratus]|nr:hypothetical protein ID866_11345 [Astraeus odoratus]